MPTASAKYVDVLLPLAMPAPLTYVLPSSLAAEVAVGCRVVVPLGKRKQYAGLVVRLHNEAPAGSYDVRPIVEVVDTTPLLLPEQWKLWEWISLYYICTPGEVMKAALPAGLKLESEMCVSRAADFDPSTPLTKAEQSLLDLLPSDGDIGMADLQRKAGIGNILRTVHQLLEKGCITVKEHIERSFRPRTEQHMRLTETYFDEEKLNTLFAELKRAPRQAEMLTLYLDLASAATALRLKNARLLAEVSQKQLTTAGGSSATLAALVRRGALECYAYEVARLRSRQAAPQLQQHTLNPAQQQALTEIRSAWREKDVCLLHGVTSSGKTEVYIHLIREALSRGEHVLFLVPEIALTTQLTTRLERVFGNKMGVYHSKFPDAERVEIYRRQLTPEAYPLMLGVRSSLLLPHQHLGLIIVDEEHEASYKQQEPAPRYNARDAAMMLARFCGAKVLLGTATPGIETYHNALCGKFGLVQLNSRHGDVQLPEIFIEDVKELRRKKLMKTPFSPRLTQEIRTALQEGGQVILFQNRRGYAPMLECRACGWTPRCTKCDVSLTYHHRLNRMVCHYCGEAYDVPKQCPACEETHLRDIGYGTEKIEAAVQACFPEARTARMDLDTTRSRSAYERIIADFQSGETNLLIGTQMVTKGLDFDRVRVVGVLNADQLLSKPDFRASERAFQMLTQVAGRAGRRGRRGTVILQTRQPENPVIRQVVSSDYRSMFDDQVEEREMFRYPPFCRMIEIHLRHRDEATVEQAARSMAALLAPHFPNSLLGPDRPAVGRIQLRHLRKIVIKVMPNLPTAGVRRTLLAARAALLSEPKMKSLDVFFDADPV